MRRAYFTLAALGLAATLTACGEKKTAAPAEDSGATTNAAEMGAATPVTGKTAKGEGEVTAIDKSAGTITIKHGPIPEAKWPAMTMAFKANPPALLDQVKVGDQVRFDLKLEGNEVTAIERK